MPSSIGIGARAYGLTAVGLVGLVAGDVLADHLSRSGALASLGTALAAAFVLARVSRAVAGRLVSVWTAITIGLAMGSLPLAAAVVPLPSRNASAPALLVGVLLHLVIIFGTPALILWTALVTARPVDSTARAPSRRVRWIDVFPSASGLAAPVVAVIGAALIVSGLAVSRSRVLDAVLLAALVPLWAVGRTIQHRFTISHWRRRAAPEPVALSAALRDVRARTAVELCPVITVVDPCHPVVVEVLFSLWGSPTLVIAVDVVRALSADELFSLLAHEAAHVRLRHYTRAWWRGAPIAAGFGLIILGAAAAMTRWIPDQVPWLGVAVAVGAVAVPRHLWNLYVTRTFEREADRFAATHGGKLTLLAAFDKLRDMAGTASELPHSWTSHGTWSERAARIRGYE